MVLLQPVSPPILGPLSGLNGLLLVEYLYISWCATPEYIQSTVLYTSRIAACPLRYICSLYHLTLMYCRIELVPLNAVQGVIRNRSKAKFAYRLRDK